MHTADDSAAESPSLGHLHQTNFRATHYDTICIYNQVELIKYLKDR
jgi:hypothetical protein